MAASQIPAGGVRRIAIAGPGVRSLARMRGALVRELLRRRHRVLLVAPEMPASDAARLTELGAEVRSWTWKRSNLAFLDRRAATASARRLLAEWEPHTLLAYGAGTMEPLLAASGRKGRVVALVNDLAAFPGAEKGWPSLRATLAHAGAAVFHNHDDRDRLAAAGAIAPDLVTTVVPGAGVDLAHFAASPLPPIAGGIVFACLAPLAPRRGVREFCEAARQVKERAPTARFLLAGPPVPASGFSQKDLERYAGAVEYLGPLDDVRPVLEACHVVVYPSHGEGMPRTVLEAMGVGRAVVTTDTPGCRETVDDRVSGCLVPPCDVAALAGAMESLLKRPDLIAAMSRAARAKAERRFSEASVVANLLPLLGVEERRGSEPAG